MEHTWREISNIWTEALGPNRVTIQGCCRGGVWASNDCEYGPAHRRDAQEVVQQQRHSEPASGGVGGAQDGGGTEGVQRGQREGKERAKRTFEGGEEGAPTNMIQSPVEVVGENRRLPSSTPVTDSASVCLQIIMD